MKNSISKSRFTPPIYKCIVVSLLVIALSIVLCSAGCSNVADSSSGSGGGGSSEPPVKVGDVVMKDGSFKKVSAASSDQGNAVAVVFKVAGGKAYAVGKKHEKTITRWCINTADAYDKKIDDLLTGVDGTSDKPTFSGVYLDGSTGWTKLTGTSGVSDTGTAGNYPAWEWVNAYGTTNSLPSTMQNGWYFPSIAELYDIWKNKKTVDASLTAIGGDTFDSDSYFSSSQYVSSNKAAFILDFNSGWNATDKSYRYYVCAVRVFTY